MCRQHVRSAAVHLRAPEIQRPRHGLMRCKRKGSPQWLAARRNHSTVGRYPQSGRKTRWSSLALSRPSLGVDPGKRACRDFAWLSSHSAEVAPELVDRGHMGPISSHIPSPSSPQLLSTPGRTQARSAQVEPEMVGPKCLGAAGYNGPCCTWALERLFGPNPRPWSTFVRLWQLFALRAQHRPMLVDVVNSGSNVAIPERCRRISDSPMWAALVQVWGSHVLFT